MLDEPRGIAAVITVWVLVVGPFVAFGVVPLVWSTGLSWLNAGMTLVLYLVSGFGISIGFHRYFTHGAFKTGRAVRIALMVMGILALEGPPTQWVAHHRRHHIFADREGDPHSPWRFGYGPLAIAKGLLFAHLGWMFKRELSNPERFARDMVADPDVRRIERLAIPIGLSSLLVPAAVGGLVTGTWAGAASGFLWAGLWRMAALHHVTWSVNSICHVIGERPFATRDRATNFWPLAIVSFGESWHNSHHADPAAARHGVLPGQLDPSARVIWALEKLGLVWHVRWPVRLGPAAGATRHAGTGTPPRSGGARRACDARRTGTSSAGTAAGGSARATSA